MCVTVVIHFGSELLRAILDYEAAVQSTFAANTIAFKCKGRVANGHQAVAVPHSQRLPR